MFNHELYAATLARAVDLMRQKDAKEQQKSALRALVTLSAAGSATVRCYDGVLSIDDVSIDTAVPNTGMLAGRFGAHNIAEVAIGRSAEPAELFALIKGLAEDPYGGPQVKDRLREAKSSRIWVLLSDADEQKRRSSVSQFFEAPPEVPASQRSTPRKGLKEEAAEVHEMWNELHSQSGGNSTIQEIDLGFDAVDETPASAATVEVPKPAEKKALPGIPVSAETPMGLALLQVAMKPYDPGILDLLSVMPGHVQAAIAAGHFDDALRVMGMLSDLEAAAPDGTPRNSYRITMRRILDRDTLVQLARLTTDKGLGDLASRVLAHAGGESVEVLLTLLAESENARERKIYMGAIRAMPQGHDRIPPMLSHPQWFVARNVAELAGELRLEEATKDLTRLLRHDDARVRKAAATALAKIGTPVAIEALRVAMKEGASELRSHVASLIGSTHAAVFTGPLVTQLETEEDPEALKEMCAALARIGTPDAMQALQSAAKQGGMFSRRGRALREACEAALKKGKK